jgi:N-acetylated-alpha-linked acidic dipeptidase
VAVTGPNLAMGGTPSLAALAFQAARDVPEPRKGGSLYAAWEARQRSTWAQQTPVDLNTKDVAFSPRLSPLGSGSDYTVFLDHLGIPSFDFGFNGPYGTYHAVYDNFRWMEKYGDPEFLYHAAAAKLWGLMAMRLASADILPLRFSNYANDLQVDLDALRRDAIRRARTSVDSASGAKGPINPDFSEIVAALNDLRVAGESADRAVEAAMKSGDAAAAKRINEALMQVEPEFLDAKGLPGRPWFRHLLIAPGLTTGYAPWPFPALQQAVEERDAGMLVSQGKRVVGAIQQGIKLLPTAVP